MKFLESLRTLAFLFTLFTIPYLPHFYLFTSFSLIFLILIYLPHFHLFTSLSRNSRNSPFLSNWIEADWQRFRTARIRCHWWRRMLSGNISSTIPEPQSNLEKNEKMKKKSEIFQFFEKNFGT